MERMADSAAVQRFSRVFSRIQRVQPKLAAEEVSSGPTPGEMGGAPGSNEVGMSGDAGGSPGLCERCRAARLVRTPRSVFWLCERSREDPRFERYPRLPVLECPGFEALPPGAQPPEGPPGRPEQ